jgi:signal transduction histidine kinase/CheY-like chemotaxis protein
MSPATIAPSLLARARHDQVVTLYGQWHRTTLSMLLGAAILCAVLWGEVAPALMAGWFAAILANQAWRGLLARAFDRQRPGVADAQRWGRYWAAGSTLAGTLWGAAAVAMYPQSPAYEALLIVCLFGVILGGLNLTAVYKPAFYGFALPALVPLIVRVASAGDTVHVFTAIVMGVVLAFLLAFGHHLNDVLTHSLAIRYENVDLIALLQGQTARAEQARVAAETANRAKSQFLAAASHDLRQPLHALGLFAAALATRTREPELRPLVASIHASVDALETLFGQLLDLSRLDAGALTPERTSMALAPLFARLANDFAPQAAAHGLRLALVPTTLHVDSDPLLLERILRNLVANAIRYTRSGGVVVGARRRRATVRIDVVDSGIGISREDRERIFDEFVQAAAAPRNHAGGRGLGLGLAIVRRLAALLGHRLELASTPGRGSRFSVEVPRAQARLARATTAAPPEPGNGAALAPSFAGRCVAVIDDDPAVVAAMRALFTAWGARVVGGENVPGVVGELRTSSESAGEPDLVVADLRLANGDCGIAAVTELAAVCGRRLPALIVSGDTAEDARNAVAAAGFTLLAKPLVAAALQAAALAALDGKLTRSFAAASPGTGTSRRRIDAARAAVRR